ncbi:hypothetical protein HID58_066318 [Brassica napus]|uniref:(rape) hypothetical protein n=1 Tax=Brassica napus TaxID=3708 RepID=A0A078JUQ6_BRANA|nr:uncharacterized protein BNACNNG68830D [Brassica napus]KAH0878924.1 hypothetical protein HID58_066318 [Brassica napus]CAF1928925.1 unnamed protein product [Brassica napus]CDY70554.1 BnaCnng68830D [Brassica napus]
MGIFPGFGAWISENTQHPTKSEKNVKSKPMTQAKTHEERDETKEQLKLWRDANKKEQYHEPPPTVKVRTHHSSGLSDMKMEFTLGLPPQVAYDVLTNPDNITYSREIKGRPLLKAVSRKVIPEKDEDYQGSMVDVEVENELSWNFLFLSGTIPIRLNVLEDPKTLYVHYLKQQNGIRLMENFEGRFTVEPVYVDAERLCKHRKPKSREEYRKCSGGKGLIASKIKVNQTFRPASPWDLPLVSSYVRRFTVETTKKVAEDFQMRAGDIRGF